MGEEDSISRTSQSSFKIGVNPVPSTRLEGQLVDLNDNRLEKMTQPKFVNLVRTLYALCRNADNEPELYQSLSSLCNLLVDMGNLESSQDTFQHLLKKTDKNTEHENNDEEDITSTSLPSKIKSAIGNTDSTKWRVSVVQFLAAVHNEEKIQQFFQSPTPL